jgi:site-specific recombinase XerD
MIPQGHVMVLDCRGETRAASGGEILTTRLNHRHITRKHLIPRFGEMALADVTTQEIQAYVAHLTQQGYAPKTIDHLHDVLSAILRTAVKWGHLKDNPARGADLPTRWRRLSQSGR